MSCHSYVFLKELERNFCLLMRARKEFRGSHGQINYIVFGGDFLEKKEDIKVAVGHDEEIIMALGMIRHMYHKGEISEIVYKKYPKGIFAQNKKCCTQRKIVIL